MGKFGGRKWEERNNIIEWESKQEKVYHKTPIYWSLYSLFLFRHFYSPILITIFKLFYYNQSNTFIDKYFHRNYSYINS